MNRHHTVLGHGKQAGTLAAGVLAMAAMVLVMATGPVSTAQAAWTNAFCTNVWLQPEGQSGDSCDMELGYANHYSSIGITTQDRAGCVQVIGYYGEPISGWSCTGNWSQQIIGTPGPTAGTYRGRVRNHNTVNAGGFSGGAYCDPTYCT